jgi:hypothetical protein
MNYVDGWGNNQFYIFGTLGDSFSCTSTTLGWHIVANIFTDLPVVTTSSFTRTMSDGILIGTVSSSLTIIKSGVVYSDIDTNPMIGSGIEIDTDPVSENIDITFDIGYSTTYYARAFAQNSLGFGYIHHRLVAIVVV